MILVRHCQSEFNLHYGRTGIDPGIVDPRLTEEGRQQAGRLAGLLARVSCKRLISSPYRRAIETASALAMALQTPLEIERLVGERMAFVCDVGSPVSHLSVEWPDLDFTALDEHWWPQIEEDEATLQVRCRAFRAKAMAAHDTEGWIVVSHWGFIRGLTGLGISNGTALRYDPISGRAESLEAADPAW